MKDKFIRVPHNDILRKAVQDQAFALGKKWYGRGKDKYHNDWAHGCLILSANEERLMTCSNGFALENGYEELTLSEFFSLKEKEPDFFDQYGDKAIVFADGIIVGVNELADAIVSKAMAKLKE